MRVCGVDPGIYNIGLCVADVDTSDWTVTKIVFTERVNLANLTCAVDCQLKHSCNIVDRVIHFIQLYSDILYGCDLLLLEQQMPMSTAETVQALLYYEYRYKARLVSPVAMHKSLGMSKDYDERKTETEAFIGPYMTTEFATETVINYFKRQTRAHDMADAFALILYHVQQQRCRLPTPAAQRIAHDLASFRFVPV
jgi:hypothetical protein